MMELKNKVIELLAIKSYTYADLASHLGLSEAELDIALELKTIEIRTLENISKELRIPLYSFFRKPGEELTKDTKPYYDTNVWSNDEIKLRKELADLQKTIATLTHELNKKDMLIDALESELKKASSN